MVVSGIDTKRRGASVAVTRSTFCNEGEGQVRIDIEEGGEVWFLRRLKEVTDASNRTRNQGVWKSLNKEDSGWWKRASAISNIPLFVLQGSSLFAFFLVVVVLSFFTIHCTNLQSKRIQIR
jgi:hypothetical protein